MKTSTVTLNINGNDVNVDIDPSTPLLWILREHVGLMGTKYGCGIAQCGSCTVLVNGNPIRSCIMPASSVEGSEITTIEGLSNDNSHPLQKAWIKEQVPQCGYCQSGQIMQAVSLYNSNDEISRDMIVSHMNGVICRCGTYTRIVKAIETAINERES